MMLTVDEENQAIKKRIDEQEQVHTAQISVYIDRYSSRLAGDLLFTGKKPIKR